jgi:xanthine dehydrogenase large subunit
VHSSTQHPTEVQEVIAHLLGLDMNQVVVITKRMGGAFGGKEAQATHPAAMAALVARTTKRPARIVYDKDSDMHVTGKRHPFQNRYRVGFTRSGEITAFEVDFYSDGGAYADLSPAVMARAMTHAENAYFIPHVEIRGTVCRTNLAAEHRLPRLRRTAGRRQHRERDGGDRGVPEEGRARRPPRELLRRRDAQHHAVRTGRRAQHAAAPLHRARSALRLPRAHDAVHAFNESSPTHLKGLSMTAVKFGISFNTKFLNQANALVNVYLDGSVQVSTGATEMGQGVNTKIRQLVADDARRAARARDRDADVDGKEQQHLRDRRLERRGSQRRRGRRCLPAHSRAPRRNREALRGESLSWEALVKLAYQERVSLGERGFYATPRSTGTGRAGAARRSSTSRWAPRAPKC